MAQMTTSGATGYAVEYAGSAIRNMSMEGRLTLSNLSIEMGSRAGLIAPDETTFAYLKGREYAPKGADWDKVVSTLQRVLTGIRLLRSGRSSTAMLMPSSTRR